MKGEATANFSKPLLKSSSKHQNQIENHWSERERLTQFFQRPFLIQQQQKGEDSRIFPNPFLKPAASIKTTSKIIDQKGEITAKFSKALPQVKSRVKYQVESGVNSQVKSGGECVLQAPDHHRKSLIRRGKTFAIFSKSFLNPAASTQTTSKNHIGNHWSEGGRLSQIFPNPFLRQAASIKITPKIIGQRKGIIAKFSKALPQVKSRVKSQVECVLQASEHHRKSLIRRRQTLAFFQSPS